MVSMLWSCTPACRRWPNVINHSHGALENVVAAIGLDDDLIAAVTPVVDEYIKAVGDPLRPTTVHPNFLAAEWAVRNVIDAAVDEQERREASRLAAASASRSPR